MKSLKLSEQLALWEWEERLVVSFQFYEVFSTAAGSCSTRGYELLILSVSVTPVLLFVG